MFFASRQRYYYPPREKRVASILKAQGIDVFIDIGANEGQTYKSLRKGGYKGRIICVEPLPFLQKKLQHFTKKDHLLTVLPPLAIGDKDGECVLNVSKASVMSSLLLPTPALLKAIPETRYVEEVQVPMKTLNSLYKELGLNEKRTFIKMDTQGYEMPILRHAEATLAEIKAIQLEMSLFEIYEGEALYDEIASFLKEKGFHPHMLVDITFSPDLSRQLQVDGIFCKAKT